MRKPITADYLENLLGVDIPREAADVRDYCIGYFSRVAKLARPTQDAEKQSGWDTADAELVDEPQYAFG